MWEEWKKWIASFNQSCADGDWSRLNKFLDEDVQYSVVGAPFACALSGRENVIKGFAKSIANFDTHFDDRGWYGIGMREFEPGLITGRACGVYRKGDCPVLSFAAKSTWQFRGGRLAHMTDIYDTEERDLQEALEWLEKYGEGMDPR